MPNAIGDAHLQAMKILREAIGNADERYITGERLMPERDLGEVLGISRRAVREALNVLEGEGLIFRRQGQGTFIREVGSKSTGLKALANRTSPQDIIEARLEIEPILARLSAIRATPLEIDQMKLFVQRAGSVSSAKEYERWDSAFHAKIAESVRNSMLWGVFRLINSVRKEQGWIASRTSVFTQGVSDEMMRQHSAIVWAIEKRIPDKAEEAMRAHILTAGARISQSVET
ncbi:FadR family transcriptional regulator [Phyllobacterium phragmitis]|uniref:FadR family transcriptional regulator n=1 Tax=Phyllobacterium phragmitis TaxID=2670329 RepID=A0A2S9IMR5_9HYPH|nr:FCD domain-containing protein [Phyllobacterium phragmitis]PRD41772.1 FadR family transcriptional regulator [Phyllobacterium phragmitis]